MRAVFILTTVVLALALGILTAVSESGLLMAAVAVGFVSVIWGVSHLLERLTGGDMWHFTAPYPYRWMGGPREAAGPLPHAVGKPVDPTVITDDRSALPLAA
jgi:hypothetical protein